MKQHLTKPRATGSDDTFGRGMDIALTVLLFFGIGFAIDHWLGTTPWFMIGLTVVASIGFFISIKYQYVARMERLEAERADRSSAGGRSS
ncbi:MAG: AtpZ/AtpI family protein [Ilumatobacteraceae bacterium]